MKQAFYYVDTLSKTGRVEVCRAWTQLRNARREARRIARRDDVAAARVRRGPLGGDVVETYTSAPDVEGAIYVNGGKA